MRKILHQYFGGLIGQLNELEDFRKRKDYEMAELIFSCISMFLFKQGSRNQFNNLRTSEYFCPNMESLFGLQMAHMDTVNDLLQELDPENLETIKADMIRSLIKSKVIKKVRGSYLIAVDGSGIWSSSEDPGFGIHKTSKNGVVSYQYNMLEAKIVTPEGLALSVASEPITNTQSNSKQDCEQAAFKRIAAKIKKMFPQLSITILADALYPNDTFFTICDTYKWNAIVNLKEGNLKKLQEDIGLFEDDQFHHKEQLILDKSKSIQKKLRWVNELTYKKHHLNWFENTETTKDIKKSTSETKIFTYLSTIKLEKDNILLLNRAARCRWKIENEGFNIQKNNGYELQHKYSRKNEKASMNYYLCLQIAHIIKQLVERTQSVGTWLKKEQTNTIKFLDTLLMAYMMATDLFCFLEKHRIKKRFQIRFAA